MRACEPLLENGHEHVDRDRDPDLRLHRVGRDAEEGFDLQALLDPLEEELDLPSAAVEMKDRECREGEVVGDARDLLPGFKVA